MDELWDWWQHLPQNISPVIFEIGSFKLQYYGLMYIVAFAITFFLVLYRVKREDRFEITADQIKRERGALGRFDLAYAPQNHKKKNSFKKSFVQLRRVPEFSG